MDRSTLDVADVFRQYGDTYRAEAGGSLTSVDTSKPAIDLHFKTGHHARGERDGVSFTAGPPWTASLCVVWCASCAAHT